MIPKLQSNAKMERLYFSGKCDLLPLNTAVGEPCPIFKSGGRLSAFDGDHLSVPGRHPNSPPLGT